MSGGNAAWLVALALCACDAFGYEARWPKYECSTGYQLQECENIDQNVTKLSAAHCDITTIKQDHLKCYPNLEILDLGNNEIDSIKADTFDLSTNLNTLYLGRNAFLGKNLPSNLFRNCRGLREIVFDGNDMSDTPEELLRGLPISEVLAANCSLQKYPPFISRSEFQGMRSISLEDNKISRLDDPATFANTTGLESLSLSNNRIDYLHADLLKPLVQILTIYMKGNKIRYIPDAFFQKKRFLLDIDLSDNLIEYVPASAFLASSLRALSLDGNRLTSLPVNFVTDLRNTAIDFERFYFDRNPFECACLNELLSEVKKLKFRHSVDADGSHQVCILTDSFKCHRREVYLDLFDNL